VAGQVGRAIRLAAIEMLDAVGCIEPLVDRRMEMAQGSYLAVPFLPGLQASAEKARLARVVLRPEGSG